MALIRYACKEMAGRRHEQALDWRYTVKYRQEMLKEAEAYTSLAERFTGAGEGRAFPVPPPSATGST
jgi:hypothetical protein